MANLLHRLGDIVTRVAGGVRIGWHMAVGKMPVFSFFERKLLMSILARINALESAAAGVVATVEAAVTGAATAASDAAAAKSSADAAKAEADAAKAASDAVAGSISDIANRVTAVEASIGTEPAPAPAPAPTPAPGA